MAAVEVTISGVLYDKHGRTVQNVVLIGEASLTGIGVGGGPMPPGGDNRPPVIWGPPDPRPNPPIYFPPEWGSERPPVIWGPPDPRPNPPIYFPPNIPPGLQPPEAPPPGSATTPLPPPAGSGGWPVQPIQPPQYMVVWYPGIGPVVVAPPASQTVPPATQTETAQTTRRG